MSKQTHSPNHESALARLAAIHAKIWGMLPEAFELLKCGAFHSRHDQAEDGDASEPQAKVPKLPAVKGAIAVLPIRGAIGQRLDWWTDVSTEWLGRMIDELMANQAIGAIVLDIDSPGGTVYGVPELAAKIRGYRESGKPIYAVANATAFSAAYFLASQAEKVFVIPSGKVGSIGVWSSHMDISKWEEDVGIKTTLVSAGKYKVEGNPFEPLGEEARAEMQRSVDHYYAMFIDAVAAGRGAKASVVRETYGQGRLVEAPRALELGMVDGVATLEEVLAGLTKTTRDRQNAASGLRLAEAEIALRQRA